MNEKQVGLKEPIHGRLFQPHVYNEGIDLYWNDYVNCGVEVEMVLALGKDLKDEDVSDESLIDAIEYVSPVVEIHNFEFRFSPMTSQELISTNGIHACLVVGHSKVSPKNLSFQTEIFEIFKNSILIDKAPASHIMSGGGPLRSLRWLLGYLKTRNQYLKAGDFVIPGTPAKLVEIEEDTELSIAVSRVGSITTKFKTRTKH